MVTMDFSQRMGLAPTTKISQVDSIDEELKNALWNVVVLQVLAKFSHPSPYYPDTIAGSNSVGFTRAVYADFFKLPVDTISGSWSSFKSYVRERFFKLEWHRLYSFLEFIVSLDHRGSAGDTTIALNKALERENSAYRFVSGKLTPITSSSEVEEVERALAVSDRYAGARTHLQTSLGMLTDRINPDYRNSIKESISAVESLAKKLVGDDKATLGQALKELEAKHNLHASLKSAFMTLYGYTSDAGGIRHALLESTVTPNKADARFMLICCSAFINFAIDSIEG